MLERAMIESSAFRVLSGTGIKVLLDFLGKRKIEKKRDKVKRKDRVVILNNGQLVYTYDEAKRRGITRPAFARALDDLIEHGFLDVAQSGAGLFRSATLYALSDRWKSWGTDAFVHKSRPKGRRHPGFKKGHPPYSQKRKSSSNGNITGSSNGIITSDGMASNGIVIGPQRKAIFKASNESDTVL